LVSALATVCIAGDRKLVSKSVPSKPLLSNDIKVSISSGAARIEALTVSGQAMWRKTWSHPRGVGHLGATRTGTQPAISLASIRMRSLMFKITQNTINGFTLAEILLMAAMNELEAKRKASAKGINPERTSYFPSQK
jgi:hypothetical protein